MASVLTIVFCGLFALTGYTGMLAVGGAVVLGQLLMATLPAPTDAGGVPVDARPLLPIALGSLVATGLMMWPESLVGADGTEAVEAASATPGFQVGLGPGIAVALLTAMFVQMRRKDGRGLLVASLTSSVAAAVVAVCLSVWVTVPSLADGESVVAAAAAGAAAASLVWLVPGPRSLIGSVGAFVGAVAGGAFGYVVADGLSTDFGAALGLTAGMMIAVGRVAARAWVPPERASLGFEGVAPLALAAPLVYLVGQFYVL
ncbi:MAG: hypothetical protein ACRDO7_12935 [Nocardioidaceae bacterium]